MVMDQQKLLLAWRFGFLIRNINIKTVPIGKPISNTRLYIVDENLAEVSAGETGNCVFLGYACHRGI